MVLVSDDTQFLALDDIVFLATKGSPTPHSLWVDGVIEELIDPPTFTVEASEVPQTIAESMFL